MTRRLAAALVGLLGVVGWSGAVGAQAPVQSPAGPAPVVSETRRREILHTAEQLGAETFADALKRAEAGDVEAQVLVAIALTDGLGVSKDTTRALQWTQAAADKGHPMGQNMLGNLCERGTGVEQDPVKAAEWFARAAAQGYGQAQANLGRAYFNGRGVRPDPAEAVRLFRLAADQGNVSGQLMLAYAYETGRGVERNVREVAAWYRKAAEQGDAEGQCLFGIASFNGAGVPKNKPEAEEWFKKASAQGHAPASFLLGLVYVEKPGPGRLDPVSTDLAIEYFERAAAQGLSLGAFSLGEMFTGRLAKYHVEPDDRVACKWYRVASALDSGGGPWDGQQPEIVAAMRKDLPGRLEKIEKRAGPAGIDACRRTGLGLACCARAPATAVRRTRRGGWKRSPAVGSGRLKLRRSAVALAQADRPPGYKWKRQRKTLPCRREERQLAALGAGDEAGMAGRDVEEIARPDPLLLARPLHHHHQLAGNAVADVAGRAGIRVADERLLVGVPVPPGLEHGVRADGAIRHPHDRDLSVLPKVQLLVGLLETTRLDRRHGSSFVSG